MAHVKGWMRKKMVDLLFGDEASPAGHAPVENREATGGSPAVPSPTRDEAADVESQLSRFFDSIDQGNRKISAGRLQMVDLAGLREHLGGQWEKGGEMIHQMAAGVIKRHLGRADVMSRHKDDSYIVLFAELSEEEAQIKAKFIADEIEERLLGASSGEHAIKVKSVVAHVDGSVAFKELDGDALIERLMAEAEEQFAKHSAQLEGEQHAASSLDDRYEVRFSPIWYVPKQVVSAHLCRIETRDGADAMAKIPDAKTREGIDHFALQHGVERLVDQLSKGQVEVVMVPVHYETLMDDHGLRRYIEAMSKVPEQCRHLICHQIQRVPNELAPARFNSVMSTLKQYSRAIICLVALDVHSPRLIEPTAVHSIAVDLRSFTGQEAKLMVRLQSLAAEVERRRFKSGVFGLRTRSQVMGALAAGFTYIHGTPIRAEHGGLAAFGLADLYASS